MIPSGDASLTATPASGATTASDATPEAARPPRRIVVALDASSHSHAALAAAVALAGRLQAELQGIFVEDVNLLRLAELPFAREVRFGLSAARPVRWGALGRAAQFALPANRTLLRRQRGVLPAIFAGGDHSFKHGEASPPTQKILSQLDCADWEPICTVQGVPKIGRRDRVQFAL